MEHAVIRKFSTATCVKFHNDCLQHTIECVLVVFFAIIQEHKQHIQYGVAEFKFISSWATTATVHRCHNSRIQFSDVGSENFRTDCDHFGYQQLCNLCEMKNSLSSICHLINSWIFANGTGIPYSNNQCDVSNSCSRCVRARTQSIRFSPPHLHLFGHISQSNKLCQRWRRYRSFRKS